MNATRTWVSIVIFLSSYSPLSIVLFLRDLNAELQLDHAVAAWSVIIVGAVSVLLLFVTMRGLDQGLVITVRRITLKSSDLVNYTIPYMVSFFTFDLNHAKDILIFCLFLVLMCYLTIRTQSVFINPILALQGYGLYELQYEERGKLRESIFLSKLELSQNDRVEIQKLTTFLNLVIRLESE